MGIWNWQLPANDPDSLRIIVAPLQHVNIYNYNALSAMGEAAGLRSVEVASTAVKQSGKSFSDKLKKVIKPVFSAIRPPKGRPTSGEQRGRVFLTH